MLMPNRHNSTEAYRYGFGGKEKDDEVKGTGNQIDYGSRAFDSRLGRWMSVDSKWQLLPGNSPYNFVINSPLMYIDINGEYLGAGNQESWSQLMFTVFTIFNENDALMQLFKRDGENLGFAKIDPEEFERVLKDVKDPRIKALAIGYYQAINSTEENYIFFMDSYKTKLLDIVGFSSFFTINKRDLSEYDMTLGQFIDDTGIPLTGPPEYGSTTTIGNDGSTLIFASEEYINAVEEKGASHWVEEEGVFTQRVEGSDAAKTTAEILNTVITTEEYFIRGGDWGIPQNRGSMDIDDNKKQTKALSSALQNLVRGIQNLFPVKGSKEIPSELQVKPPKEPSSILPPFD